MVSTTLSARPPSVESILLPNLDLARFIAGILSIKVLLAADRDAGSLLASKPKSCDNSLAPSKNEENVLVVILRIKHII